MSGYRPPTTDMRFTLEHVVGLDRVTALAPFAHVDGALVAGALEEAGRFAAEVIAPLARIGDQVGSIRNADGSVTTPPGYRDAYRRLVEAGWPAAAYPEEWGGGGLPRAVGVALQEMIVSADMAFSLCSMLTSSACELLLLHGDAEQQATYLPKLVSGEWTGTMLLTEPQAGSDLGTISTRARPAPDGTWRLTGTKIFITWGEHDLTENIIHMVLARVPDAPPGTRGISCFIVPRHIDGARNDVTCVSIEHKLGIHASPTCVLSFGDRGEGAVGFLLGETNQGMRLMFTMMNHARLSVGLEGLAVAERAYQQSAAHARERSQGRAPGDAVGPSPIIRHPDVRRMLMTMRSRIEAMRAVMYRNALAMDLADHHPDEEVREAESEVAALLTPISKAWGTDLGVEMASLGIQIHGGMGYVEDTGAAQWWRDSRIAPIYEGTNGIQAVDLVNRKITMRNGGVVADLLAAARQDAARADGDLMAAAQALVGAADAVEAATKHLLASSGTPEDPLAAAVTYLSMLGDFLGGWLLLRGAVAARNAPPGYPAPFLSARAASARFYADHVLSTVAGRLASVTAGAASTFGIPEEEFPGDR